MPDASSLAVLKDLRKNIPHALRDAILDDLRANTPKDIRETILNELREKVPNDIREELLEELREDIPDDIRETILEELRDDMPDDIRVELLEELRENMPDDIMDNLLDELRQDIPENFREVILDELREDVPDDIREELLEELREDVPDDIKEIILDELREDLPNDIREELLEELREDVPNDIREELLEELREKVPRYMKDTILDELRAQNQMYDAETSIRRNPFVGRFLDKTKPHKHAQSTQLRGVARLLLGCLDIEVGNWNVPHTAPAQFVSNFYTPLEDVHAVLNQRSVKEGDVQHKIKILLQAMYPAKVVRYTAYYKHFPAVRTDISIKRNDRFFFIGEVKLEASDVTPDEEDGGGLSQWIVYLLKLIKCGGIDETLPVYGIVSNGSHWRFIKFYFKKLYLSKIVRFSSESGICLSYFNHMVVAESA